MGTPKNRVNEYPSFAYPKHMFKLTDKKQSQLYAKSFLAYICDHFFSIQFSLFSYPSVQTCVLGAQKNRLDETVLLSTHNICFV